MPVKVEKKDFEREYKEKGSYHHNLTGFKKFFFDTNYKLLAKGIRSNDKVLDIACGDGAFSNYLPANDIVGVDNAPTAISLAKKLQKKGEYKVMDIQKLDFKDKSFDVVTCSLSLFYFDRSNINIVLKEVYRVLKDNGKFVFSYKNLEHPQIRDYISKLESTMEAFTMDELTDILKRNKFSIEKIAGTNLMLDLGNVPEEKLPEIYEASKKIAYYVPRESYHYVVYAKK